MCPRSCAHINETFSRAFLLHTRTTLPAATTTPSAFADAAPTYAARRLHHAHTTCHACPTYVPCLPHYPPPLYLSLPSLHRTARACTPYRRYCGITWLLWSSTYAHLTIPVALPLVPPFGRHLPLTITYGYHNTPFILNRLSLFSCDTFTRGLVGGFFFFLYDTHTWWPHPCTHSLPVL